MTKNEYAYSTGTPSGNPKTISYSYDASWKDKLISYNGKNITYDDIGNPLTYDGWTFTWEQGRQLRSMIGNGYEISFKYNDAGIRTEKTVVKDGRSTTYKYHLLGDKVTHEQIQGPADLLDEIHYTYSGNTLVSMNLNGREYYYVRNAQGDITGLLDINGKEVVKYSYDSWGKLISIEGKLKDSLGLINPYRYRGYRCDNETGLYYLQSRYYNPELGRFINADDSEELKK